MALTGFTVNPVVTALAVRFAGDAPTLTSAFSTSAFNVGIAAATAVAGTALDSLGLTGPALVGAITAALILVPLAALAIRARSRQPARPEPSGAQKLFGDFAPALVHFTDDVLFGEERSLVTVAAPTTNGNTEQLVFHLGLAKENGNTEAELIEAITHLAFYVGWPQAMAVARRVFRS